MRLNSVLTSILLCVCIFAATELGITFKHIGDASKNLSSMVAELNSTIKDAHKYADSQIANLQNQQNSIKATIQAAAVLNGTFRVINSVTLPKIHNILDTTNTSMVSLNNMINHTDANVNQDLFPEAVGLTKRLELTADKLNISLDNLNIAIKTVTDKSSLTLDDINAIMGSQEWLDVLSNVDSISKHTDEIMGSASDAAKQMPSIAASVEKLARTSSKYSKALILAEILSTIGKAVIP